MSQRNKAVFHNRFRISIGRYKSAVYGDILTILEVINKLREYHLSTTKIANTFGKHIGPSRSSIKTFCSKCFFNRRLDIAGNRTTKITCQECDIFHFICKETFQLRLDSRFTSGCTDTIARVSRDTCIEMDIAILINEDLISLIG